MEHSPLLVSWDEALLGLLFMAIPMAIFVLIAGLAGLIPIVWLIASLANRDRLRREWDAFHDDPAAPRPIESAA